MLSILKNWLGIGARKASRPRPTTQLNVESLEGREVPAAIGYVKIVPPYLHSKQGAPVRVIPGFQIRTAVRVNPFVLVDSQPEPPTRGLWGDAGMINPSMRGLWGDAGMINPSMS